MKKLVVFIQELCIISRLNSKAKSGVVKVSDLAEAYTKYKTCMMPIYVSDGENVGDYYLIQMYRSEEYGLQILFALGGNIIRYRRLYGTWTDFAQIYPV